MVLLCNGVKSIFLVILQHLTLLFANKQQLDNNFTLQTIFRLDNANNAKENDEVLFSRF